MLLGSICLVGVGLNIGGRNMTREEQKAIKNIYHPAYGWYVILPWSISNYREWKL